MIAFRVESLAASVKRRPASSRNLLDAFLFSQLSSPPRGAAQASVRALKMLLVGGNYRRRRLVFDWEEAGAKLNFGLLVRP